MRIRADSVVAVPTMALFMRPAGIAMPAKNPEDKVHQAIKLGPIRMPTGRTAKSVIEALNKLRATEFASSSLGSWPGPGDAE